MTDSELDDQSQKDSQDTYSKAKHAAVGLLSRREHSRKEIITKLSQRSYLQGADFEALCDELELAGWLSQSRFAESFIRARRMKGQGPVKIIYELRQRGLTDAEFQDFMAGYDDWSELAYDILERRFGQSPTSSQEQIKMQRFLQQRGFDFDAIKLAVARLKSARKFS